MAKSTQYDRDELIRAGRGTLFGPQFAKLPLPNLLMLDRVVNLTTDGGRHSRGSVRGELDIRPDLWFFECHFQDDPIMPGCFGIEALWQLTAFYAGWREYPGKGRALGVGEVKFRGEILPDTRVVAYEVDIARVKSSAFTLLIADGRVYADEDEVYAAKSLRVGVFPDKSPA